jgi:hypothetical protein
MTEPLKDVRVGMTGHKEIIVTRELTVGGHVEGMPPVYATPMMIMLMEGRLRRCGVGSSAAGLGDSRN